MAIFFDYMIELFPDYYFDFKCIADKCTHTCCAGWEIDIDEDTLEIYQKDGLSDISLEDTPHFILKEGDRCPFLRDDNLCQLIIDKGENYLCQICTDHPRYRNFWTGITETGLGLSCEEAAKIILTRKTPMRIVDRFGNEPGKELIDSLPEDERFLWEYRDRLLKEVAKFENPIEARLAEYFIFRQIPDALYDDFLIERTEFVWYSIIVIFEAWDLTRQNSLGELIEASRKYSEEVEYNPEKMRKILESYC